MEVGALGGNLHRRLGRQEAQRCAPGAARTSTTTPVTTARALTTISQVIGSPSTRRATNRLASGANEVMTPARYAELMVRQSRGIPAAQINLEGLRKLGVL